MTDSTTQPDPQQPTQLVDRVRLEMARRRALTEALRPPKRRPDVPPLGAPLVKRPPRRTN